MDKAFILLVDDNTGNLQVLGNFLEGQYRTAVATDGLQALKFLQKRKPDLILLDVMMPGMDGFEVCRKLKEAPNTRDIPVIFLTAKADTQDVLQGFALGAVDYVTKPFEKEELVARVRTHLELKSSREIIARQNVERKEMLHVLCHDLKNPIGAIANYIDFADDPEELWDCREDIRLLTRQGLEIIELVRKIQKLEEFGLELQSVDLRGAVFDSIDVLHTMFSAKGILVEHHVPEGLSVLSEKVSLVHSVINNLLTNAIKFSRPGATVHVAAEIQGDGRCALRVRDQGIGMPASLLANLFDLKEARSRPGTQGESGTGFGMPLIRKFVEAYGGSIDVKSKDQQSFPEEHGTEVTLIFRPGEECHAQVD